MANIVIILIIMIIIVIIFIKYIYEYSISEFNSFIKYCYPEICVTSRVQCLINMAILNAE